MSRFISKKFQTLEAYTPGEQPKINEYIKLNTNESPFPVSPIAKDKIKDLVDKLNIYNDNSCKALTETFANYYNVETENVIFANGSDEILAFCFLAFCNDYGVCYPEISYGFYKVFSKLFSCNDEKIALKSDLSIDIKDYFDKGKTIVIANPNAPTALALTLEQIEEIVIHNKDNVVIIDEAYVDFGAQSAVCLTKKYDNLIISGTFSKSRNLAGARLGYAIANSDLIADLNKIKYSFNPYNVNTLTQALGMISLENDEYFKACIKNVKSAREEFVESLDTLGFTTLKSSANFVFTKSNKIHGEKLYKELKDRKILVRHFDDEKICDYVRISIGTHEQMREVIENIKQILKQVD